MKIDCNVTENYLREKQRMTGRKNNMCKLDCLECPLSVDRNGYGLGCNSFVENHPKEAIAIVQKWCDEHPLKTYKEDFFEKFPNAPHSHGIDIPECCRNHVYGDVDNCAMISCGSCWNSPMKER